jgi:hypothetical protein
MVSDVANNQMGVNEEIGYHGPDRNYMEGTATQGQMRHTSTAT